VRKINNRVQFSSHVVNLVVNDDTRSIVDDPDLYYQYLTNLETQQQRLEKEANPSASQRAGLHFFRSYGEKDPSVLENENHFATTNYYRSRLRSWSNDARESDDSNNGKTVDSCRHGHYVYGRPFSRIAHYVHAWAYMGEIYVEVLDRNKP